jgi:hypothetical protein
MFQRSLCSDVEDGAKFENAKKGICIDLKRIVLREKKSFFKLLGSCRTVEIIVVVEQRFILALHTCCIENRKAAVAQRESDEKINENQKIPDSLPWRREALAAGSSSIISASHRGHWSN